MNTTEGTKTMKTYTSQAALIAATLGLEAPEPEDVDVFVGEHIDEMPAMIVDGGLWSLDSTVGDDSETPAILHDYTTGEPIREATDRERGASEEAAETDGGAGVIEVDGRACYVQDA